MKCWNDWINLCGELYQSVIIHCITHVLTKLILNKEMRKIGQVLMLIPLEFTSLELSNFTSCNVSNWYFPIFLTLNIRFLPNNLKWNERASRALVLWYISLIWWRWKLATFTKWFTVRGYDVFDLHEHQFSLMKSKFQAYVNSSTVI